MSPAGGSSRRSEESSDWGRSPSALFACALLGLASVSGLAWSLSRTFESDPRIMAEETAAMEAGAESAAKNATSPQSTRPVDATKHIDVNTASLAELDLLPGIGPALGRRIIDYRQKHGPFETVEALQRVSGIGPKTLEKIRPLVVVGRRQADEASEEKAADPQADQRDKPNANPNLKPEGEG